MLDFHPEAVEELKSSLAWYLERSGRAAAAFLDSVRYALSQIEAMPEQWACDADGFRFFRLRKYPFQIVYRTTNHGLRVLAVSHTARRPGYWRERR